MKNRRQLISALALALALLNAPIVLTATAQTPPNILLVIADDMGLDATNCYQIGTQQAPMPTLEQLCAEGMVFDNAYAAPVCSPTRAGIMSGQYGFQTGVGGAVARKANAGGLSSSVVSLFDLLAQTNYRSALIGKWHIASAADGLDHPTSLGVDHYFGLYSGRAPDYSRWQAVENGRQLQVDEYTTTAFTDRAIDWIAKQQTPWFLWLAHNAPHSPFHLPPTGLHRFDDLPTDEASIRRNPLPYYQAMLEALDTELGRLLNSLPPETRDNTLVIFIGDNGTPNQVSKALYPTNGAKGTLYEAGINVPMVIAGPGVQPSRSDSFVSTVDLYATIASIAGASSDTDASHDFSAVLKGGLSERDYIYAEHFSDRPARGANTYGWSIRTGEMKLLNIDGQPQALYNVATDPMEQKNLLANNPTTELLNQAKALNQKAAALRSTKP
jgi:arylsulfatase A-like enzyme